MRHLRLPQPPAAPNGRAAPAIAELSIDDMRSGYEGGAFAVQDVAASVLSRIAALEPFLNAFIWINERMGEDAERLDAAFTAGGKRGPLHGIPVVLKDNMNVAGVRTTAGYAGFASDDRVVDPVAGAFNGVDLVPQRDATLVARLRKAGALIVGKSNLPDFALDGLRADLSHNGDTLNPYGSKFAPGASSSGSAAAVATGMGVVSIGTDTAGSILFPVSAQSLVGLKPSFGLVPGDGIYPGLPSHHDVAGPIAKSVRDAAIVLEVLVGERGSKYTDGLRKGALAGRTIGLFELGQWSADLHPAIADHYRKMVAVIEGLGARTVPVVFGDTDWVALWSKRTYFAACNSYWAEVDAFLAGLGGDAPASRSAFTERAGFDIGLGTTAPLFSLLANPEANVPADDPRLAAVIAEAGALRKHYEEILARKGVDALFVPRSVNSLPDLDGNTGAYLGDQVVGTQVNEMGLPAITVPAGFLADGRPIAIDIVGRGLHADAEILAYAYDFEQETRLRQPPPEL